MVSIGCFSHIIGADAEDLAIFPGQQTGPVEHLTTEFADPHLTCATSGLLFLSSS